MSRPASPRARRARAMANESLICPSSILPVPNLSARTSVPLTTMGRTNQAPDETLEHGPGPVSHGWCHHPRQRRGAALPTRSDVPDHAMGTGVGIRVEEEGGVALVDVADQPAVDAVADQLAQARAEPLGDGGG